MGSFGTTEILLIFIAAFLIFGPEKLPQVFKKLGRFMAEFRNIKEEVENSIYDVKETIDQTLENGVDDKKNKTQDTNLENEKNLKNHEN